MLTERYTNQLPARHTELTSYTSTPKQIDQRALLPVIDTHNHKPHPGHLLTDAPYMMRPRTYFVPP